jgi:hypothetical protein
MGEHLRGYVPGDLSDDAVVGLPFAKSRNRVIPAIMKSETVERGADATNIGPAVPIAALLRGLL